MEEELRWWMHQLGENDSSIPEDSVNRGVQASLLRSQHSHAGEDGGHHRQEHDLPDDKRLFSGRTAGHEPQGVVRGVLNVAT